MPVPAHACAQTPMRSCPRRSALRKAPVAAPFSFGMGVLMHHMCEGSQKGCMARYKAAGSYLATSLAFMTCVTASRSNCAAVSQRQRCLQGHRHDEQLVVELQQLARRPLLVARDDQDLRP